MNHFICRFSVIGLKHRIISNSHPRILVRQASDLRVAIIDDQSPVIRIHSRQVKLLFQHNCQTTNDFPIRCFTSLPTPDELIDQNLILLDQNLGKNKDGIEQLGSDLAYLLANDCRFCGVLVIMVTSDTPEEVRKHAPNLEFNATQPIGAVIQYLAKPFDRPTLARYLEAHFGLKIPTEAATVLSMPVSEVVSTVVENNIKLLNGYPDQLSQLLNTPKSPVSPDTEKKRADVVSQVSGIRHLEMTDGIDRYQKQSSIRSMARHTLITEIMKVVDKQTNKTSNDPDPETKEALNQLLSGGFQ